MVNIDDPAAASAVGLQPSSVAKHQQHLRRLSQASIALDLQSLASSRHSDGTNGGVGGARDRLRLSAEAAASREERRATGRLVAVIVALLMIFSGFYQAWIKRIPVLAGVMVPMLIMFLYAGWVLFLAKRDKQRRLNQENHIRSSMTALSDILIVSPPTNGSAAATAASDRRGSIALVAALAERRASSAAERRLSHSAGERRLSLLQQQTNNPTALQRLLLQQQFEQALLAAGGSKDAKKSNGKSHRHHHHHHHHKRQHRNSEPTTKPAEMQAKHHHHRRRSSTAAASAAIESSARSAARLPFISVVVEPPTPLPAADGADDPQLEPPRFPTASTDDRPRPADELDQQ